MGWTSHRLPVAALLTYYTGVSLITQVLYALVFSTRYLDIFTSSATKDVWHTWNFSLKVGRARICPRWQLAD